jgi:hypothetical protein
MTLLTNPAYFSDRENIRDNSALVFPRMMRYLYRMLTHIYYHHKKLFNSLEDRYRMRGGKQFFISTMLFSKILI